MKQFKLYRWLPKLVSCAFLLVMLAFGLSAGAQGANLLTNPGFEQPFATVDGVPARIVAQGWSPWHIGGGQSASENVQPEYYPASDATNGLGIPRVRNGSDAQQYLAFFATLDGGVYQRVTGIASGASLRFSAFVYVWSSTFDDVDLSEGNGGVVVQVGIDPTGGTNGESSSIIWSAPTVQYDSYNEYSVTATASATSVTVFVRSTITTAVKNTNIYVDDASLTSGTTTPATATTSASTPTRPVAATNTNTVAPTSVVVTQTATRVASTATTVSTNAPATATRESGVTATTVRPTNTLQPSATTIRPTNTVPPTATAVVPTATQPLPTPTQAVQPSSTPVLSPTPITNVYPGTILHTVQSGDIVVNLAALYGSSIDAIIAANDLGPSAFLRIGQVLVIPVRLTAPATSTPTATPLTPPTVAPVLSPTPAPGTTTTYVIQPGDTLSRIAARFNTTARAIAQLNGITNLNVIRWGQRLIIPVGASGAGQSPVPTATTPVQPTTYTVRPGDTLFRIALRFGVPMSRLMETNRIANASRIYIGQVLVIP
ncbi:MAG: LysM peptidoglycan-binding domain-containing protein [Anaerolineae bacterium]|nr:LysM peptidoglycan-binding domain-containing protein [Anaerolineae bacterium]